MMSTARYVVDEFALVAEGSVRRLRLPGAPHVNHYIECDRYYQGEYYFLLLCSILGSLVMASSRDLIVLFIGLELVTGPLFLLAGWRKGDVKSNEASLKYFILGVLSTALLLYGMSLIFGLTGRWVSPRSLPPPSGDLVDKPALVLAILFMMVGFGFKMRRFLSTSGRQTPTRAPRHPSPPICP